MPNGRTMSMDEVTRLLAGAAATLSRAADKARYSRIYFGEIHDLTRAHRSARRAIGQARKAVDSLERAVYEMAKW